MKMEDMLAWYETMERIRQFELLLEDYNQQGKIYGTSHLYIGQEAVATGIISQLGECDLVLSSHRNHGHAIAKGVSTQAMFAEIFGKASGSNGGRAGSMLLSDRSCGFIGGNGIVGGSFPLALGLAQALKMDQRQDIVLVFAGDGAVNQGTFYESLNLAQIWKLPLAFIIENNRYAMSTDSSSMTAGSLQARVEAMSIPYLQASGQDIFAVAAAFSQLRQALKAGPVLLELETYRFKGHSRSDHLEIYREAAEKASVSDPIDLLRRALMEAGVAKETLDLLRVKIQQDLQDEARQAFASPEAGGSACRTEK